MAAGPGISAARRYTQPREGRAMTRQTTRREFLNDASGITAAALRGARGIAGVHGGGGGGGGEGGGNNNGGAFDVPPERRFIGFDGYRHAMDCLRPGDVVILATPPAFRWVHFTYAIERGLNVFLEKPLSV